MIKYLAAFLVVLAAVAWRLDWIPFAPWDGEPEQPVPAAKVVRASINPVLPLSGQVYALGSQSAYRVLETAFEALSDNEKSNARGNLFAGLAGSEYLDDFGSGDFLIKNILGADPDSGAVVIGGIPRVGQTLQYQIRDRQAALEDLRRAFEPAREVKDRTFGALLFSCLGRGSRFFGKKDQDAAMLSEALDGKPCVGFFCNGEIAPVRGLNALHGNTAAAAVLIERDL